MSVKKDRNQAIRIQDIESVMGSIVHTPRKHRSQHIQVMTTQIDIKKAHLQSLHFKSQAAPDTKGMNYHLNHATGAFDEA